MTEIAAMDWVVLISYGNPKSAESQRRCTRLQSASDNAKNVLRDLVPSGVGTRVFVLVSRLQPVESIG